MRFSDNDIEKLKISVSKSLSPKRFSHVLGVERAAAKLAEKCAADVIDEIRVAAILHDITKEHSHEEQLELISKYGVRVTDDDLSAPETLHALTAPPYIAENYPEFATELVLSSISYHTVGNPDMDVAEAILFVADFIEDGRTYPSSVNLREKLYAELDSSGSILNMVSALCGAVIDSINATVEHLTKNSLPTHPITENTRMAFVQRKNEIDRLVESGRRN